MAASNGQVAEWLKAADCKSARVSRTLVRIQPCPPSPDKIRRGDSPIDVVGVRRDNHHFGRDEVREVLTEYYGDRPIVPADSGVLRASPWIRNSVVSGS